MKGSLRFSLLDVFGLIMSAAILVSRDSLLGDPGVGWHLKAGEWMWANWALPFQDPFLADARAWVHDQWLSDMLLWKLYSSGGFPALHAIVVIVSVATFLLVLAPLAAQTGASALAVFLVLFLMALHASLQWFLRPVIFSFLLFALAYRHAVRALERGELRRVDLLLVPGFFALWANLHPGFWLGLYLLGACALELWLRRKVSWQRALIVVLAGLCATLLNPWGPALWTSTLGLGLDPYFTRLNREWLNPDLADPGFFPATLALILLVVAVAGPGKAALRCFDWLLLLPLLGLALLHRRYLPFLSIVLFLPLIRLYPAKSWARFPVTTSGKPVLTCLFWMFLFGSAIGLKRIPFFESRTSGFPRDLPGWYFAQIRANPGPIFHSPDIGGFITWGMWPEVRALIDDRNQLLGRKPYEEFFTATRVQPDWEEILTRGNYRWALLGSDYPLAQVLERNAKWERVAQDGESSWDLFRRRD